MVLRLCSLSPRSGTVFYQEATAITHEVARIELWWLPLGAGGWFVRFNGRVYEALRALRERRRPLDLYYSALVVWVP